MADTKYVVYVQLDIAGDNFGEYSGIEHDDWIDAKHELNEAMQHDEIYHGWIREEEHEDNRTFVNLSDL